MTPKAQATWEKQAFYSCEVDSVQPSSHPRKTRYQRDATAYSMYAIYRRKQS
jgi:hypothetical protein